MSLAWFIITKISVEAWRSLRPALSPMFTSSKMKMMFSLMTENAKQFVDHFRKLVPFEVELKDVFTRYSNDLIATVAFGLTCDSFTEKDNPFYLLGKDISNFSGLKGLCFVLDSPWLLKVTTEKINENFPNCSIFRN